MPRYLLGQGVNLEHYVYDRDGALTDATVAFTATPLAGSPVAPSVSHVSTGRYRAATFVPVAGGQWTYQVAVTGAVSDVAYGTFTIVDGSTLAIPPAGAYASQADLADIINPLPDNADLLLIRAARLIDRALICSWYDPTSAAVIAALKAATLEQIAGSRASGDTTGLGILTTVSSFTLGKLTVQQQAATSVAPTTNGLVDQAWLALQAAGLTGHGPGEPSGVCW